MCLLFRSLFGIYDEMLGFTGDVIFAIIGDISADTNNTIYKYYTTFETYPSDSAPINTLFQLSIFAVIRIF